MVQIERFFPTDQKVIVEDYPYGRQRTKATFSIEFKHKKGFRYIFQTVNPKTGRINNPKKSTYTDIMVLFQEKETKHIKPYGMSLNGAERILEAVKFMDSNFDLFSPEQIKSITISMLGNLKVDMKAQVVYAGCKFEDIEDFYRPIIKKLVAATKVPTKNLFKIMDLDIKGIKSKEPKDFNPFEVKEIEL